MWLIIRDSDNTVVGTNYANMKPPIPDGHTGKEWWGQEPNEGDIDPTLASPVHGRIDFDGLADQASAEIAWLSATIPQIETMTIEDLRGVLLRLTRENLKQIKAWRYLFGRLG